MGVIATSVLFTFILSHIMVDQEFNETMKLGAYIVMGLVSGVYLVFGILT